MEMSMTFHMYMPLDEFDKFMYGVVAATVVLPPYSSEATPSMTGESIGFRTVQYAPGSL